MMLFLNYISFIFNHFKMIRGSEFHTLHNIINKEECFEKQDIIRPMNKEIIKRGLMYAVITERIEDARVLLNILEQQGEINFAYMNNIEQTLYHKKLKHKQEVLNFLRSNFSSPSQFPDEFNQKYAHFTSLSSEL